MDELAAALGIWTFLSGEGCTGGERGRAEDEAAAAEADECECPFMSASSAVREDEVGERVAVEVELVGARWRWDRFGVVVDEEGAVECAVVVG